ncbi:MAG: tRNA 2-thiouridine(34) synthase MnmA [Candidatus Margulisiibacteriota bacterium]
MSVKNKVLIAMSGGVDSSVAAALLKEQEYDLIGVTMTLYCSNSASERSCCSASAAADAKKVADRLGFPHYTINFKDDFQRSVIHNFIEEYKAGRTPNPCVRCNQFLKFDLLPRKAREMGAEFVATGHYARIMANDQFQVTNEGKARYILFKGKDPKKDQSYFLYRLTQGQLAHTLFPLGGLTKEEVRLKARALGLPVAEKKESQEICFIEDDNYGRFLREKVPEVVRPGPIIDKYGNKVGEHEGLVFFTIGQRKGVGAHREPRYVIGLDNAKNAVVIGSKEETYGTELTAEDLSFISGRLPVGPLAVTAKIRYNAVEAAATVTRDQEGAARVVFAKPQLAITPGQSVVFYKGEEVLGGGIISRKDK